MRSSVALHPHWHLVLSGLWVLAFLKDMWQHHTALLVYISLMTHDVEYLLICLLAVSISSFLRGQLRSPAHFFKTRLFAFLLLNFKSSYILDNSSLSDGSFINVSHACGFSLHSFDSVFCKEEKF